MRQSDIVNPIGVELDETARRMAIRWDDGHLGYWSWEKLRRACPCALCAGEGNLPGVVTEVSPSPGRGIGSGGAAVDEYRTARSREEKP